MAYIFNKFILILIAFFCFLSTVTKAQQKFNYYEEYEKYQLGDSLQWKELNYNDENWNYYMDKLMDYESSDIWLRIKIITNTIDDPPSNFGLTISVAGTYQLFWNGIYIGTNCREGTNISKHNGVLIEKLRFPDSIKIYRQNILSVRMSIPEGQKWDFSTLEINNYNALSVVPTADTFYLIFLILIYIMLAIYYSKSFIRNKTEWHQLFFAVLISMIALNTVFEMISYLTPITYRSIILVDHIELYLNLLLLWSFPLFFIIEFGFPVRYTALFISAGFILACYFYFDTRQYFESTALIPGILIIAWTLYKRREGGINALFGMFVFISILLSRSDVNMMRLSFLVFPFFISISLSKQYFRQKRKYQITKTQSARLESEMLRKIIQPHYLMNSLNAALEWIEDDPQKGVEFIQALSEEFRNFLKISNLKLIPIQDEISMCRGHVKIMKFRKDKNYKLFVENISIDETVPPAIFHTTIENGITHEPQDAENSYFIIREEKIKNGVRYRVISLYGSNKMLQSISGEKSSILVNGKEQSQSAADGTGYAYIKARLSESYADSWKIYSISYKIGWETVIEIYSGNIKKNNKK